MIHCDIKPGNVFLTTGGTVKLLDFGLARMIDAETDERSAHLGASATLIQQRAGTLPYMSPEHRRGEPLDARSDVYSLGIVIHEMATGHRPPAASGHPARQDDLGAYDPALPKPLQPLVARALAPDPMNRPASAVEVEAALRRAQLESQGPMRRVRGIAAAAVLTVLVAAALVWNASRPPDQARSRPVLAVLPFSATGDDTTRYLAAGLTEIVTNDLAGLDDLVVVSNSAARSVTGNNPTPARIAAELGASHLITGALSSDAQLLHIRLHLFTAASGATTPLGSVDASFAEVAGNERRIAETIRTRFLQTGLVKPAAVPAVSNAPSNPRALEDYARGREYQALEEVTRAIALRPTSDEAHRLIGRLYAESGEIDKAIPAFQNAIRLRPGSWESYHALGLACFDAGRYTDAIEAFTRETELRPDSASPFQALGTAQHAIGNLAQALANYERAIAISPSAFAYSNIGMLHYAQGRFSDAVAAYEQSVTLAPTEPVTHRNLGDSLLGAGDKGRARASYRRAIELAGKELGVNPKDARLITLQAVSYAKLQEADAARQAVTSALAIATTDSEVLFQCAVALAVLGDLDEAMVLLKDAISRGYSARLAAADSDLAPLRRRQDFKDLVAVAVKPSAGK